MVYRIVPKSEDELYHYGILGMRWGVRRFQNYDGSRIKGGPVTNPTHAGHPRNLKDTVAGGQGGKATGNARFAASASPKTGAEDAAQPKKSGMFEPTVKKGKGKEDSTPAAEIAKSVENSARSTKDLLNVVQKHDPKIKKAQDDFESEAKKMSDKELRDRINRIKMEREYVSIKSEEVSTGYQKAKDVLDVVGDIAQIAFAVAGTIAMLKKAGIIHSDEEVDMVYDSLMSTELDDDFISHAINMDDEYCLDYLEHHGVLGMKWGVRRYQNYDGTRIGTGGGGGGSSKASKSFRDTVVGGQGGKAKGNARLAATAEKPKSTQLRNTIVGGQGGEATGNARLAATAARPKSSSIRNTIVGGQGGEAKGNARLAAKMPYSGISKRLSEERKQSVRDIVDKYNKAYDAEQTLFNSPDNKRIIELQDKIDNNDLDWFELQDQLFMEPNDNTPKAKKILKKMSKLENDNKPLYKERDALQEKVSKSMKEIGRYDQMKDLRTNYANLRYEDLDDEMVAFGEKYNLDNKYLSRVKRSKSRR